MIPLRDVMPSPTTPRATLALIAVHAAAFGLAALSPDGGGEIVRQDPPAVDGSWIAGAVSLVVHAGWLSLALNLGALWLYGENLEDRLGHGRFLAGYLASGALGVIAGSLTTPDVPPSGASGAVAGVVAGYLMLFPGSRLLVAVPTRLPPDLVELSAAAFAGAWFLLQVAMGIPAVTLFAGAAAGTLAARLLRRPDRLRVEWWGR
jgi:membrane associated rhomboid family serine protease